MFIPTKDCVFDLTPTDFEKYSLEILKQQTRGLENLEIKHNIVIERSDSSYQIDDVIRFDVMGVRYTTLIECQRYKGTISREKVRVLSDKVRATCANKEY